MEENSKEENGFVEEEDDDFIPLDGGLHISWPTVILYALILFIGIGIIITLLRKAENGAYETEIRKTELKSDLPVGKTLKEKVGKSEIEGESEGEIEGESEEDEMLGTSKENFRKEASKQIRDVVLPQRID